MSHHYLRTLLRAYELNKLPKDPNSFHFVPFDTASINEIAARPIPFSRLDKSVNEGLEQFLEILAKFGVASGSLPQFKRYFTGFAILKKEKLYPQKWFNYSNLKPTDFEFYCNPLILSSSSIIDKNWEYCSSFDCMKVAIPRSVEIEVSYVGRDLEKKFERLRGFQARLFQHEFDHLKGILLNQHMTIGDCEVDYKVQSFFGEYAEDFEFDHPENEEPYTELFKESFNKVEKNLSQQFYGDNLDPNHIVG